MAGVLSILSNFSLVNQGSTYTGKQGLAADDFTEPLDIVTTGPAHIIPFALPTATVITIYDDDNDFPVDWDFAYLWSDQTIYIQLIGTVGSCVFKVLATVPFWPSVGFDEILPAASTSLIAGGTEPTMEVIDSIALGNYSGTTANGYIAIMD